MALMDAFPFNIRLKIWMPLLVEIMNVSDASVDKAFWSFLSKSRCSPCLAAKAELVFEHGEISKIIAIPIINDLEAEKDESFAVELSDPKGGATLGKRTKIVITIINDDGESYEPVSIDRRTFVTTLFRI